MEESEQRGLEQSAEKINCKNCNFSINNSDKYCNNCGQKNTDGRISISSFFSSFFSTVFNLESKFFMTMGHIFVPGKLTVEYFKGKHKRYFHPVRLFIVSALFLIAAIGNQLTDDISFANIYEGVKQQVHKEKFLADLEHEAQQTLTKFPNTTSLKPALDTLYQNLVGKEKSLDSISMNRFFTFKAIDKLNLKISNEDFINLNAKELMHKYKVESRLDRFVFQQKIKLIKDKGNFASFLLGNSLWIILLMMPFLALILKVLYIRHDYFYAEHLVFSFHTHAFAFLFFALIGFVLLFDGPAWLIPVGFLVLFIYLYKALKKVYRQKRSKTLVKLFFANIVYLFLFLFFLIFGLLASMAIF